MSLAPGGDVATIREVVAMVEGVRREIFAELEKVEGNIAARSATHTAEHEADEKAHKADHQRDLDRRLGYMRWAVTTILTGIGTLFAIVWALVHR